MQENQTVPTNKPIEKKKIILIGIIAGIALLLIIVLLGIFILRNRIPEIKDVEYTNQKYGFTYSSNIKIKDTNNDGSLIILSRRDIDDDRTNTVRVEVYKQVGFELGAEFANFILDNIEALNLKEYEVIRLEDTTIADKEGYNIRFSYKEDGKTVVSDTTYVVNNGDVYEVSMNVFQEDSIDYEIIYSKVLHSLKIN